MLTAERLRQTLKYDPNTGWFMRGAVRAGFANGNGYRRITIDGRSYYEHRLVWLYVHGRWPFADIDHRDAVKSHNWLSNLREVSRSDNNVVKARPQANNRSGFHGVSWCTITNSWVAEIKLDKVKQRLGRFQTPEAAAEAYQKAKTQWKTLKGLQ